MLVNSLDAVLVALVVGAAIVVVVRFEVFCLTDIAQADEVRYLTKPAWVAICLLSIPLGGLLYLIYGRAR
jgi:hypothetical protein